ncbi:MAG: class I SAM-dependent methyltransferase [Clostridiales bacterium]|nr:class I SAM-dependent methyltransferase [Clostridiales bacterium]
MADKRLRAIVDLVPRCRCTADIGADHGKTGTELLLSGKCDRVVFSDISAPSLEKARNLIFEKGLEGRAEFLVADGLKGLSGSVDCIVIAGMGGQNIRDIVLNGKSEAGDAELILQPNTGLSHLRRALTENGFMICNETVAAEDRRYYVIICAVRGQMSLDEAEILAGPVLLKNKNEVVRQYYSHSLETAEKLIMELKQSGADHRLEKLYWEREIWKAALSG